MTPTERKQSQSDRRAAVERGETVVANLNFDHALIRWARKAERYTYIGRGNHYMPEAANFWGNPFRIPQDGDRDEVCAKHKVHFTQNTEKQSRIHELKGRVLGCSCFPLECHGNHLAAMADQT